MWSCSVQGCFLWFLCHPILVLMSVIFNEHQKEKVWTPAQRQQQFLLLRIILSCSLSLNVQFLPFVLHWPPSLHAASHLSSSSAGGDHGGDPLPVHLHGHPLPALPVSLSLLGGVLSVLSFPAPHHVQNEPQGALLSMYSLTIFLIMIITS